MNDTVNILGNTNYIQKTNRLVDTSYINEPLRKKEVITFNSDSHNQTMDYTENYVD
jgi:hypothetical protein